MEIRMEHTDGLGQPAEVWVDGELLCACDGISTRDRRCRPGVLTGAKFSYVAIESDWSRAVRGNPGRRKLIESVRKWSYVGYGQVQSVMPVVIDFGLLTMTDPHWTNDANLVGKYVKINIDRLELVPDDPPDWPDHVTGRRA